MGLGPSTKMTTLHHYRCPLTKKLLEDGETDFAGIIVDGVSENFDDKVFTAERSAELADLLGADGALVAIDGWGNHHVDFVHVIEQLGIRGIPAVGLSYIAQQGRLVCSNSFVDCIVDFNKSEAGYESCIVGENNPDAYDAVKALALLKNKMNKWGKKESFLMAEKRRGSLEKKVFTVKEVRKGNKTEISGGILYIGENLAKYSPYKSTAIKDFCLEIRKPGEGDCFVNSNLDFSPLVCKTRGKIGEGVTHLLKGVSLMLTGVEETGFQPCNIGSSQGILKDVVVFNKAGTPSSEDYLLHLDVIFKEGEARSAAALWEAHRLADGIAQEIRRAMSDISHTVYQREKTEWFARRGKRKVVLIKIVSGLGNMYDTALFPDEPCGIIGAHNIRESKNIPYLITPLQCLDGVLHSLL